MFSGPSSDLREVDGGGAAGALVVDLYSNHPQVRGSDAGAWFTLVLLLKSREHSTSYSI